MTLVLKYLNLSHHDEKIIGFDCNKINNYNNVLINISLLYNNNYKIFSEIFYNSKDIDNIHSGFGIPNFNLLANYLFLI